MSSLIEQIRKWLTPDAQPVSATQPGYAKLPEVEREEVSLTPKQEDDLEEDTKAAESEGMTPPEVETPEAPSEKGAL